MSCCEQACVTYEYRPHRLENSAQCGIDTRMNLPNGQWTSWSWSPHYTDTGSYCQTGMVGMVTVMERRIV